MRLAEGLSRDRDENNFNLIRIIAAFVVLVSHSFVIATGDPAQEPLRTWLGTTPGTIGVDVFFITSGFLVTKSLIDRNSIPKFAFARFLRIYPAMLIMVLATTFLFGLFVSHFSFSDYIFDKNTLIYFLRNSTIVFGPSYFLPDVFTSNPNMGVVNGSLWSMKFELWMYIFLTLIWIIMKSIKGNSHKYFFISISVIVTISLIFHFTNILTSPQFESHQLAHLTFMFFTGSLFYSLREKISLRWGTFAFAVFILAASVFYRPAFSVIYALSIAYIVFCLAYLPRGALWSYNKLGDYSYGLYIYAYPIEQTIALLNPRIPPLEMVLMAAPATMALAILSWHVIEKRALRLKI